MKKKTLLVLLFVLMISAIMTVPVLAAESTGAKEPEYDNTTFFVERKIEGEKVKTQIEVFFANGTPITIEKLEGDTDGTKGALIKWNGGSRKVGNDAYIFGGMHNNATTKVSTSITMNGGTVRNITGGGLHGSYTVESNIVVNGGQVGGVQGGGADGIAWDCGCTDQTDAMTSNCQTEKTNVTINGGTIKYTDLSYGLVYGGGEGHANTEEANVTINGGYLSAAYVTAGGSHGNTTEASLTVTKTDAPIMVAQSVNRGTMENATVKITGGEITNLYVAALITTAPVGVISGEVTVEVSGDAKVETMQFGQMGTEPIVEPNEVIKKENITIVSGTVTNSDSMMDNVTRVEQVKIDGKTYLISDGDTVKDIPEYEDIIKKEGYKFIGFTWTEGAWDIDEKLFGDLELKTVFDKIEEEAKDETPKMGVESIALTVFAVVAVISLAGLAVVKKDRK